nr:hypothetical protein [Culturomica sp.]
MDSVKLPGEGFKLPEHYAGFRQTSGTEVAAHEDTSGCVRGSVTGMDQDAGAVGNIREIDF